MQGVHEATTQQSSSEATATALADADESGQHSR